MLNFVLISGGVSSLIFCIIILLSWRFNPEVWIGEIEDSDAQSPQTPVTYAIFISIVATLVVGSYWAAWQYASTVETTFLQRFVAAWLVIAIINVVDLIVIDWLVNIVIDPKWMTIPGYDIQHMKVIQPHIKALFMGLLIAIPIALLAAAISGVAS
ncbi:MAG: hypothetical protein AAF629_32240 [Chloroflexota bacterium]